MTRTLTDEIISIIKDNSNDNLAPETATIHQTYTDHYIDAQTTQGILTHIPAYGDTTTLGKQGIIIYINGDTPIFLSPITDTDLQNKQDKLISGENIKTINNNSLLGSGNINIGGSSSINMVGAFTITNGHLIVELPDGYSNPYSINDNGHLIYDTSATGE